MSLGAKGRIERRQSQGGDHDARAKGRKRQEGGSYSVGYIDRSRVERSFRPMHLGINGSFQNGLVGVATSQSRDSDGEAVLDFADDGAAE